MNGDFFSFFKIILAASEQDKARVYSLRHQVYCEELGYEPINPAGRVERDNFDTRSLHCLIEHRATGLAAGCLRVVIPSANVVEFAELPIEEHCRQHGVSIDLDPCLADRDALCEISRVAIPQYFRSVVNDGMVDNSAGGLVFSKNERTHFPMIGICLFLCATAITGLVERHHVLAMMEGRFHRLLARSGLRFARVSNPIEFRGQRAAFYIDQRHAEIRLRDSVKPFYLAIKKELSEQFFHEKKCLSGR